MRLRKIVEEFAGQFTLVHRAFVLRPEVNADATFSAYHRQHRERAAEMTELPYALPEIGAKYPSSSWPALCASKWVSKYHSFKFQQFDAALFAAFFERLEDISDPQVLANISQLNDIDPFELKTALGDKNIKAEVAAEHDAAQRLGINGIPAVIIGDQVFSGAVPIETYREAANRIAKTQG